MKHLHNMCMDSMLSNIKCKHSKSYLKSFTFYFPTLLRWKFKSLRWSLKAKIASTFLLRFYCFTGAERNDEDVNVNKNGVKQCFEHVLLFLLKRQAVFSGADCLMSRHYCVSWCGCGGMEEKQFFSFCSTSALNLPNWLEFGKCSCSFCKVLGVELELARCFQQNVANTRRLIENPIQRKSKHAGPWLTPILLFAQEIWSHGNSNCHVRIIRVIYIAPRTDTSSHLRPFWPYPKTNVFEMM